MTKVVLEQENTAASLHIKVANGKWAPLEFLHSNEKRTADLRLTVDPGKTVFSNVLRIHTSGLKDYAMAFP